MPDFKRYLVTAALPYANGPLHIGHLAGAYLPADIYVRYLRLKNADVKFICGSDEHGVPITLRARNEGITPQQVVDKYHKIMGDSFKEFGISFDIYSRTSNKVHHETASDFFKTLYDKKVFTEEITEQYFDEKANQFLADRYIIGTCPKCGFQNAYGEQCEKCGSTLSPRELINPKSALSGNAPVLKKTKHWYLPLDKIQNEWLQKWIESKSPSTDGWKTNVFGQCKSWLDQGLQPRAVTRDLDWGVDVPSEIPNSKGKKLYVWFDAPIGYISATKALTKDWKKYWQDKETKLVHFIGKDNIVFHCIIFPAMLKAHGNYILPDNVPANEFLNLEGDKISTSRNWAVWLNEYLEEFPNKQDELRYVLNTIFPETSDSEFTWKDYQAKVNNELVAILGNFVNRTLVLLHKYCNGKLQSKNTVIDFTDKKLHDATGKVYDSLVENIENYKLRNALFEVIDLARTGNKYMTENEPWKVYASNPDKAIDVLNNCLVLIAHLGACLQPFLPFTSKKVFKLLNLSKDEYKWADEIVFENGHQINQPELLYQKIEDDVIQKQIDKLHQSKKMNTPQSTTTTAADSQIAIGDFAKVDIRVGKIIQVDDFPEAKKPAFKLTIDFGGEIGVKKSSAQLVAVYKKEELIGKLVLGVVNFAPRKIGPFVSEVLTLGVPDKNGNCILIEPERDTVVGGKLY